MNRAEPNADALPSTDAVRDRTGSGPSADRWGPHDVWAVGSLCAIGMVVYGVFVFSSGYYWDDWPVIWVYRNLGAKGLAEYFSGDRVVSGWLYAHLLPLFGLSPLGWQIADVVLRCASSVLAFCGFCRICGKRKDVAWIFSAILLLYPGFTEQPIALSYFPHLLSLVLFTGSLSATVASRTARRCRGGFSIVAIVAAAASYFVTEYFVGLELFRLLIIWQLISSERPTEKGSHLKSALKNWSPYATVWIAYLLWRGFVFHAVSHYGAPSYKDATAAIGSVINNPFHEISFRIVNGVHNILMSSVIAWARPFQPDIVNFGEVATRHAWIVGLLVAALAVWTLRMVTPNSVGAVDRPSSPERFGAAKIFVFGVGALFVAELPFSLSSLTVGFGPHPSYSDRFTLPFMFGSSLTAAALLAESRFSRLSKWLLIPVAFFSLAEFQFLNGTKYREDWRDQKALFWQMAWRAPGLKPGTAVFVDGLPGSLVANHAAGMLNLLYERNEKPGSLDYFIFDLKQLSWQSPAWAGKGLSYKRGDPISGRLRNFQFQGNTAQCIIMWISPSDTMRIVMPLQSGELLDRTGIVSNIAYLSNPAATIEDGSAVPAGPLLSIFGKEPEHGWLYLYQRAELDRQQGKWTEVASLGDAAMKRNLQPLDPSEWFPFIEGYTRTGHYDIAASLTRRLLSSDPESIGPLSAIWTRVRNDGDVSTSRDVALRDLSQKLELGGTR